jgi:hypothetical protein
MEKNMEQAARRLLERHLPYELNMFERAFEFVSADPLRNDPAASHLRNFAIEAFWTHARNLNYFMKRAPNKNASGEAAARDFTDDDQEMKFSLNEELEDKINQQISHLQYERPENEDEQLMLHDMQWVHAGINSCVKEFERRLTSEAREIWQRQKLREIVQNIPAAGATTTNVVPHIVIGSTGPLGPRNDTK